MKLIILFLILLTSSPVKAGDIGIIYLDKVIFNLNEYKKIDIKINKIITEKKKKVDWFNEQISMYQKKISTGILSKEALLDASLSIKKLEQKKNSYINESQSFVNQQESILRKPLVKKTLAYLKEYAKKNNFDLIIDGDSIVLENNKQLIDISESVLKDLNLQ